MFRQVSLCMRLDRLQVQQRFSPCQRIAATFTLNCGTGSHDVKLIHNQRIKIQVVEGTRVCVVQKTFKKGPIEDPLPPLQTYIEVSYRGSLELQMIDRALVCSGAHVVHCDDFHRQNVVH